MTYSSEREIYLQKVGKSKKDNPAVKKGNPYIKVKKHKFAENEYFKDEEDLDRKYPKKFLPDRDDQIIREKLESKYSDLLKRNYKAQTGSQHFPISEGEKKIIESVRIIIEDIDKREKEAKEKWEEEAANIKKMGSSVIMYRDYLNNKEECGRCGSKNFFTKSNNGLNTTELVCRGCDTKYLLNSNMTAYVEEEGGK